MAILDSIPDGAKVIDLEAARVARAEARESKTYVKLSAGFVEVKPEIALESAEAFEEGRVRDGISSLLADPADVDALYKDGISAEDLAVIVEHVSGKTLGELSASQQS